MSVKIYIGDCRDVMAGMEAGSVHCVATSPPFYGLRDYGTEPTVWGGDTEGCEHVWKENKYYTENAAGKSSSEAFSKAGPANAQRIKDARWRTEQWCIKCQAWKGNLGLEPTPSMFVQNLVEVARGIWRVLRDDGLFFLNLGDSFFGGGYANHAINGEVWLHAHGGDRKRSRQQDRIRANPNLKPKDLIGIPWRVALALQADGWWLRSAMPWVKKNPMPESVTDRVTTAHEYIFMFSKSKKYWYDNEAVREKTVKPFDNSNRSSYQGTASSYSMTDGHIKKGDTGLPFRESGRNRRTSDTFYESLDLRIAEQRQYLAHLEQVKANGGMLLGETGEPVALLVNTASFSGAHFATFPLKLVKPLIACSTSEVGVCSACGSQFERVVEKSGGNWDERKQAGAPMRYGMNNNKGEAITHYGNSESTTTGWQQTCTCPPAPPIPATVFDPFMGAGTTLLQADRMNRDAIGVELNATYARDLAYTRIAGDAPMFADVEIVE